MTDHPGETLCMYSLLDGKTISMFSHRVKPYDDSSSQPVQGIPVAETYIITATQTKKEVPMNPNQVITTKTLVFGVDAAELSEYQLFDQVARVDAEIARLEDCKTKPNKLVQRIAKMKEQLDTLVKYIDDK